MTIISAAVVLHPRDPFQSPGEYRCQCGSPLVPRDPDSLCLRQGPDDGTILESAGDFDVEEGPRSLLYRL